MADEGLIFGPVGPADPDWLVLMCGARHSGKTQCIKYVCRAYASVFAAIYVFCPTSLTGAYDFLPKQYVHNDYDPEVPGVLVEKLVERGLVRVAKRFVEPGVGLAHDAKNACERHVIA